MKKLIERFERWLSFDAPVAASMDEWREFDRKMAREAPLRWFYKKTVRHFIRRNTIIRYQNAKYWILHRFVPRHKYNVVYTDLKPGYYDLDTRMLHACFTLLEDYVEIEMSWGSKKYRDAEKGLENLDYTINYNSNLPENHTVWDRMPEHQEQSAKEAKELYLWWQEYKKNDYGPSCPIKAGLEVLTESWKKENPEEAKAWKIWSDAHSEYSDRRRKEADDNLARLIAIRHSLWT